MALTIDPAGDDVVAVRYHSTHEQANAAPPIGAAATVSPVDPMQRQIDSFWRVAADELLLVGQHAPFVTAGTPVVRVAVADVVV